VQRQAIVKNGTVFAGFSADLPMSEERMKAEPGSEKPG
jgi:hypothetical protein